MTARRKSLIIQGVSFHGSLITAATTPCPSVCSFGMRNRTDNVLWCNTAARSRNRCCSGKAMRLYFLNVYLQPQISSMQCACVILASVACPALQYFSTWSHERLNFQTKHYWAPKCVFRFSLHLLSEPFLMTIRIERDTIKNVYWSSCEVHVILVRF